MKIFTPLLFVVAGFLTISSANAQVHVRGYTRSDGTYVQPHMRSAPDNTTSNNWSHMGNVNPYTGQPGTHTDSNSGLGNSASLYQAQQDNTGQNSLDNIHDGYSEQ